jgi:hypothetical protein
MSALHPTNRHRRARASGPKSATSGLMHRGKQHLSGAAPPPGRAFALDVLVDTVLYFGNCCARHDLGCEEILPAPQARRTQAACHPCCTGPSGRFHEGNRLTLIGWQRHAASGPFPASAIRTRRCSLGQRPSRLQTQPNCQTVIGTEAAPREHRPARRLEAASIGRGPTA